MIVKWSSYFLVFTLVLYWGKWCFAEPMDSEIQKVLTRLEKTWERQEKEIATANIVYLHAYGQNRAEPFCKPLTPSQVSEIVNLVDYSDPQKAFQKLINEFYVNDKWISTAHLYYHHSPLKSRLEIQVAEQNRDKIKSGYKERLHIFDGKNSLIVDPLNNQTDIYADTRGAFPITRLRFAASFLTSQIRDLFSFQITNDTLECRFENENEKLFQSINITDGSVLDYHSFFKTGNRVG